MSPKRQMKQTNRVVEVATVAITEIVTGPSGADGLIVSAVKYQIAFKFELENAIVQINVLEQVLKKIPVHVLSATRIIPLQSVTISRLANQNHPANKIAQQQLLLF